MTQSTAFVYRTEGDAGFLLRHIDTIRALADKEKEALGFLTPAAYRDAIRRGRIVAMCQVDSANSEVVGFILFSGVFPNARIQQIAVARQHRRKGIASALLNEIVSRLERLGYLTVAAAVASDLPVAQSFYERNGFVPRRSVQGGKSRNRTIVIHARYLETDSFFSVLEPQVTSTPAVVDLGLRARSAGQAPLYAIDLNVLFDVVKVKGRPRASQAEQLIRAALAHQIRLAVAAEFVVELERHTKGIEIDPVLSLARQLPRLPSMSEKNEREVAELVHKIVFETPKSAAAGSVQALSDARHLAQAALGRASGYVTSDGQMLAARQELLECIGIDVATLEEFVNLLPGETFNTVDTRLKGTACTVKAVGSDAIRAYLSQQEVTDLLINEFAPKPPNLLDWKGRAVVELDEIVGVAAFVAPRNIDAAARALVHVRADHVALETFVDHLLDDLCWEACSSGPATIELVLAPGQPAVRHSAILRGFLPVSGRDDLAKVALGRPATSSNWISLARQTRRKTGLRLPEKPLDATSIQNGVEVQGPDGSSTTIRLPTLEVALGPTIIAWPGREGVIVPIARTYADDLLGTSYQFLLFGKPEASFVTRRVYFNTPRAAGLMRPGMPMLFYESKRSGGRGAVVAVARIVDATVMDKAQIPDEVLRRAVVDDPDMLTATAEILATSFDNLLRLPSPVLLETLRELQLVGAANFQTATSVSSQGLCSILDLGWSRV